VTWLKAWIRATAWVLIAVGPTVGGCKSPGTEPEKASAPTPASDPKPPAPPDPAAPPSRLSLVSPAFAAMGPLPKKYTCEGSDTSPALEWSGVPEGTKSLALVIDDPDAPDPMAPTRVFVHWVVYNLPPDSKALAEGASASGLPAGAVMGKNDWGKAAFGGSCPPTGRHRYFHKLYALDTTLNLGPATKTELETAMRGHVLGKAELIGTYQKGQ
jgi:Raf kinase inhibitor-like YbhB/YbcL family protein